MNTLNWLNNQGLITGYLTRLTQVFYACAYSPLAEYLQQQMSQKVTGTFQYQLVFLYNILKTHYLNNQKIYKMFWKDGGML